jgi:hypothetical protein
MAMAPSKACWRVWRVWRLSMALLKERRVSRRPAMSPMACADR